MGGGGGRAEGEGEESEGSNTLKKQHTLGATGYSIVYVHIILPYWSTNFIVQLIAGASKPVRGRYADPRAAGARLSTVCYQFN